ncbi:MAG: PAS domain S-box protein [Lutibacter sp.]|nr:hypothetical protein [Lutibacter sp.]
MKQNKNALSKAAYLLSIITALTGVLVLIGWQFDNYTLKTFGFGGVTMKVNTAISLLFIGLAVIFLQQKDQKIKLYLARIFSLATLLLGALVFSQYLFNSNLGIDELLFQDAPNATKTIHPGRMAPNTSLNFILAGLSLLLISFNKTKNSLLVLFLITIVLCISIFGVMGYLFGISELTGLADYTKMALNTSMVFIIISIGLLFTIYHDSKIIVTIERKIFAGITIAVVVILFVSINSITSIKSLVSASDRVQHSELVKAELNKIQAEATKIVADTRGFLISNNEEFIVNWNQSKTNILKSAKNLDALTQNNPTQQKNLITLNQLLKERIEFSKLSIQTQKTNGPEATKALFNTLKGSRILNDINGTISKMTEEENRLLKLRNENEANKASQALTIITLSLFVQLILLAAIFLFVSKDLSGKRKAQKELQTLLEDMEEKVEKRTEDLKTSNEKIIIERDKANQYINIAGIMLLMLDKTGKVSKINKKGCEVIGYAENEIVGKDWLETVLPKNLVKDVRKDFEDLMKGNIEVLEFYENPIINKNGEERLIEWHNVIIYDKVGNPTGSLSSGEDITDRKAAQKELLKANRVYALLSNVNQTIVRITDKQTLFDEVCRIAIVDGKFEMAWVGMVNKQTNKVEPVASAGFEGDYLQSVNIDLSDEKYSNGPVGRAIKTGTHSLVNDIANTPEMIPWSAKALKQDYKSSAAFPVKLFGKTIGAFTFYSTESFFFDEIEVKLLDELAMDISFALEFIENNKKRRLAEEEIRNNNISLEDKVKTRTAQLAETNDRLLKEINERKQIEDRFKMVVESAPNAIILVDSKGKIQLVNEQTENYFGYSRNELIGNKIEMLVPGIAGMGHQQLRSDFISHPTARNMGAGRNLFGLRKDGNKIPIEVGLNPIQIQDETLILTSIIDITERKKADEEIKNAKTEAERANFAKSEFLSRMSHELRTPLNSILGFTQLMDMGQLIPAHKKGVDHIMKSGKHLLNLINEVLDLSRIEAGELSLSIEPVEINGIIEETVDIVLPMATEKSIKIELERQETAGLFVKADHQKLKQTLLNLVNNAIKYNRENGLITISIKQTKKEIRIYITDTGNGIEAAEMHKLFSPFQRIGTEISIVEGTGLGLAVSKKLIEAMNGTIGVESEVGTGSAFWIELPRAESQNEHHERTGTFITNETYANLQIGTILYIEDNVSNQELVKQIIDIYRSEIKLITSFYGKDTVKLAQDYKPNLILLDLDLPDIHGSEVLELLQKDPQTKGIPVIILSADAMEKQMEKLLKAGAKAYLKKPLDVLEFLKLLDDEMIH